MFNNLFASVDFTRFYSQILLIFIRYIYCKEGVAGSNPAGSLTVYFLRDKVYTFFNSLRRKLIKKLLNRLIHLCKVQAECLFCHIIIRQFVSQVKLVY